VSINLKANNTTERRVLEYLDSNASPVLAEKINAGKKTLAGALEYAKGEAQKLANGAGCVCVDDATVFGWIVHFFEEDHLTEKRVKHAPVVPQGVQVAPKPKAPKPAKPVESSPQLSMLDALLGGVQA
jgi:hypothetical protein